MEEESESRQDEPFGLWELDASGAVLHYEPEAGESSTFRPAEVIGTNFFGGVIPAGQAREFEAHFKGFVSGPAPAHSFAFIMRFGQHSLRTRVLMGRVHERLDPGSAESILVHIRRA